MRAVYMFPCRNALSMKWIKYSTSVIWTQWDRALSITPNNLYIWSHAFTHGHTHVLMIMAIWKLREKIVHAACGSPHFQSYTLLHHDCMRVSCFNHSTRVPSFNHRSLGHACRGLKDGIINWKYGKLLGARTIFGFFLDSRFFSRLGIIW